MRRFAPVRSGGQERHRRSAVVWRAAHHMRDEIRKDSRIWNSDPHPTLGERRPLPVRERLLRAAREILRFAQDDTKDDQAFKRNAG